MDTKGAIRAYLSDAWLMQLATVKDGQPWVCSLYFVADDDCNLYWLSWPERRHSQELAAHDNVAATVVVKPDVPVAGVQVEGVAKEVNDPKTVQAISSQYVQKYGSGEQFYDRFMEGKNQHRMYRLAPRRLVLLDEANLPAAGTRQEIILHD